MRPLKDTIGFAQYPWQMDNLMARLTRTGWTGKDGSPLKGELIGYSTSITSTPIPVDDLNMGHTDIATACQWVGYAALAYK